MKELSQRDLKHALDRCSWITKDRDFIVIGSMSILGHAWVETPELKCSRDIDLIPRTSEPLEKIGAKLERIQEKLGDGSQFEAEHRFYIEGVGPGALFGAAKGWEDRLAPVRTDSGVTGWCISPLDLAFNKLGVGRTKDVEYVARMFAAGVVTPESLREFIEKSGADEWQMKILERNFLRAQEWQRQNQVSSGDLLEPSIEAAPGFVELQSMDEIAETFGQGLADDDDDLPPEDRTRTNDHDR